MTYIEFVQETIKKLDENYFEKIKEILLSNQNISFSIISPDQVTPDILSEKLCDYFEKTEIKSGKSVDKRIEEFYRDMDSVIGPKVEKETKDKTSKENIKPRARKYYEKAKTISKEEITFSSLLDYSRIMLCLYSSVIKNEHKDIENFDFSFDEISLESLISALKSEQVPITKKLRFNFEKQYESDACSLIFMIIMFFTIKSNNISEE